MESATSIAKGDVNPNATDEGVPVYDVSVAARLDAHAARHVAGHVERVSAPYCALLQYPAGPSCAHVPPVAAVASASDAS